VRALDYGGVLEDTVRKVGPEMRSAGRWGILTREVMVKSVHFHARIIRPAFVESRGGFVVREGEVSTEFCSHDCRRLYGDHEARSIARLR
jgi:hypothetical protein